MAVAVALAYVTYIYPLDFFRGTGAYFADGDAAQHVSGWLFYAHDSWHFPLLRTSRLNAPDGVSIALTDSIPLVALFLKPLTAYLPQGFQYIGLWHGVAYLLQALAAAVLIRVLGCRTLFAAGVAAAFAVTWPALSNRLGHTSLMTHGLILFALSAYFAGRWDTRKSRLAGVILIALSAIGLVVHPYLLAMIYAIFLAYVLDMGVAGEGWRLQGLRIATSLGVLTTLMYLLGYVGSAGGAGGFDYFSMNMASPFCGGLLLHCQIDATGGQAEGFNYFGAGGLLVLAAGALSAIRNPRPGAARHRYPFLILMAGTLTLYALSTTWYLAGDKVLSYSLPSVFKIVTGTFRASGRFFWVVGYLLLFVALAQLLKSKARLVPVAVLAVALAVQWTDTSAIRKNVMEAVHRPAQEDPKPWNAILAGARHLIMYPAFGCGHGGPEQYLYFQNLAARQGLTFNTGYIARLRTSCGVAGAGLPAEFDEDAVFIMPQSELPFIRFDLPPALTSAVKRDECMVVDGIFLCRRGLRWGEGAIHWGAKAIDGLMLETKAEYSANELPTVVGRRKDERIVSEISRPGILNYGPYVDLAPGTYRVSIEYSCSMATDGQCGSWDVVADGANKMRNISQGLLRGTNGSSVSLSADFTSDRSLPALEIRSMYDGNGVIEIYGVTVERRS
ncbi:hypothetical protein GCM10027081_03590 [Cupriavidus yeoncheonensis]